MSTVPADFERLGIALTRDTKAIRRAYAVALKAIDQGQEREAFERLRQAYEQALAWASRVNEEDEENKEHEDGQDRSGSRANGAPVAPPAAPPGEPCHMEAPPLAPSQSAPLLVLPANATQSAEDARQGLRYWLDRLRDVAPGTATAALDAALTDPRLLHLDSHAKLEAGIADLLHGDPVGRAELFDTAARHFHWTDRNARPVASTAAAAYWIRKSSIKDCSGRHKHLRPVAFRGKHSTR